MSFQTLNSAQLFKYNLWEPGLKVWKLSQAAGWLILVICFLFDF